MQKLSAVPSVWIQMSGDEDSRKLKKDKYKQLITWVFLILLRQTRYIFFFSKNSKFCIIVPKATFDKTKGFHEIVYQN